MWNNDYKCPDQIAIDLWENGAYNYIVEKQRRSDLMVGVAFFGLRAIGALYGLKAVMCIATVKKSATIAKEQKEIIC